MKLQLHDYCKLFPACSPEDYAALKKSIEVDGLLEAIVLFEGKILDGRHRYEICLELGIEPRTVVFDGDDPLAYVLAMNLARRHLNASQRAMIAAKMVAFCHQLLPTLDDSTLEIPAQSDTCKNSYTPSQGKAAEAMNVSRLQVNQAAKLYREAPPEVIEQVEKGEKTIHAALKEIGQPIPGKDGKIRPIRYQTRKKTIAKAGESGTGRSITVKLDRFDPVTVNFPLPEDYVEASQYVMEAFGVSDNPDRLKDIAKDLVAFGQELQEFAAWLDRIFD